MHVVQFGVIITRKRSMPTPIKIDFVSDVSCPWCAVGLSALERALTELRDEVAADIHLQPFELNPGMPPGGQDISEHLTQKYGSTPEEQAQIRATIAQRGADVGFAFHPDGRARTYNTFDAHRLLHWAGTVSGAQQLALKKALLVACHGERQVMESHAVLLACVAQAGLDATRAQAILASDDYSAEVRAAQAHFARLGIHSVPATIVNDRHLISGGQPVAAFVQALRQIARDVYPPTRLPSKPMMWAKKPFPGPGPDVAQQPGYPPVQSNKSSRKLGTPSKRR